MGNAQCRRTRLHTYTLQLQATVKQVPRGSLAPPPDFTKIIHTGHIMSAATRSFFLQPMLLRHSISHRCCSSVAALSSTSFTAVVTPLLSAQTICNYSTSPSRSRRRRAISSSSNTKGSSINQFLTPGFQPTAITGDNIGFYHGSTFYDGVPPNTLPKLDAACILSPGKYCKQSAFATSSSPSSVFASSSNNTKQGTNSGVHAAQRLVEARREFMSLMNTELQLKVSNDENNDDKSSRRNNSNGNNGVDVRKLYVLEGHGVPIQLLSHLIQAVQSWTDNNNNSNTSQSSSEIVQISFENIHNTTMLNRDVIQIMYANGNTNTVSSQQQQQFIMGTTEEENNDWEHDFELYMVVMDRIASRLASIMLSGNENENDEVASSTTDSILGSSGSMITPASLKRWNVTIMKGEVLPLSLLKKEKEGLRRQRQEYYYKQSIFLTVEWVMKNRSRNCCNIVLRLQHDGMVQDESGSTSSTKRGSGRDPISLVFDGVYEQ